jgi:hypothetical protein
MPSPDDLVITLDLDAARQAAERVRAMLLDLRARFDLAPFEYTKQVRIAPVEIPHSHPVLTLNTWVRDELGLLCTYLHEQMHWYVVWFGRAHPPRWEELDRALHERYPEVPVGAPDGAADAASIYGHLVINWLEIDVLARFFPRKRVIAHALALPFYGFMYRTVIADWEPLAALYERQGLLPLRYATEISAEELRLAARADGAPA